MSENKRVGGISVDTEHIFPIIKKWLYSEKEIFLREVVSNACDAITKLRRLESLGEVRDIDNDFRIDVSFNKTAKTLTVSDNGIGMTEDELDRYICKIALSGAMEFIEKYEGEGGADGIIGHFGLGFYSTFMVSDRVEVITKSYKDAPAVRMSCSKDGAYEISNDERGRGTSVVMHLSSDGEEYLSEYKLREILDRYCAFMPAPIYLTDEEKADEEGEAPAPINDTMPLWQKMPSECTEEEYKAFYHKVFSDFRDPLFYVHINADYPLNFKGIIYFPQLSNRFENIEGKVKLYYNQVFVADNIKEVIPEYLMMLRGVIDCPELPLNVSRSYLQNSVYVKKVSEHITKKVADKLGAMFNNDREAFEKLWHDIKTFVEYGCICDGKFYDRCRRTLLFELTSGKAKTLDEMVDASKETSEGKIYYATERELQAQYISMYEAEGYDVAVLDSMIDVQFISALESKENGVKFLRVDSATEALGDGDADGTETLSEIFKRVTELGDSLTVKCEKLKDTSVPALISVNEDARRMEDFMKFYSMSDIGAPASSMTLVLNADNAIISKILGGTYGDRGDSVALYVYYLALMSQRRLTAEEMKKFLAESYSIIENL